MASELNRVKYAGLDFHTHEDEILARLQVKYADVYNDFAASSLGIMLIDIFAYGLDTLSFYLDRRATDLYLTTARTRKSMSRAARQIGYKMAPSVACSVDVEITPEQAHDFQVTLPSGFQLYGPNRLIFESREQYTWAAGDTSTQTMTFSEGQTMTSVYTSNGDPNQIFEVRSVPSGKFIAGPGSDGVSQVICQVDGVSWTESEFLSFGSTNQFEVGYNDDPPTLRFGDGIAGNIPPAGAEIRFTYFASSGANGQAKAGTITTEVSPLVANFTNIGLIINNPQGASGGSNPEDIEKTRALAPLVFKSRMVNVTAEDYEARSSSFVDSVFGAIAVAKAISVRGASSDVYLNQLVNSIKGLSDDYVSAVTTGSNSVTASLGTISSEIADTYALDSSLEDRLEKISDDAESAAGLISAASADAGVVGSYSTQLESYRSNLDSIIDGITTVGADALSSNTRASIGEIISKIESINQSLGSKAQASVAESDMAATRMQNILKNTDGNDNYIGAKGYRESIRTNTQQVEAATNTATAAVETLSSDVAAIDNTFSDLADEIYAHVDSFLSSDCRANLVEVPVLTLDSDGFYAVPTISLMKALQAWLDSKKEVTQVVKVVGDGSVLIRADIYVDIGVYPGYVEGTIRSQVEAAILGVLRGRRFGDDLQLSELYWVVQPETSGIAGIEHVNIEITGPAGKVDSQGNLVAAQYEVITRGTITVVSTVITDI